MRWLVRIDCRSSAVAVAAWMMRRILALISRPMRSKLSMPHSIDQAMARPLASCNTCPCRVLQHRRMGCVGPCCSLRTNGIRVQNSSSRGKSGACAMRSSTDDLPTLSSPMTTMRGRLSATSAAWKSSSEIGSLLLNVDEKDGMRLVSGGFSGMCGAGTEPVSLAALQIRAPCVRAHRLGRLGRTTGARGPF